MKALSVWSALITLRDTNTHDHLRVRTNESAMVRCSGSRSESLMQLCNTTLFVFPELASFFFFFFLPAPSVLHFTAAFGCVLRQQSTPASSDPGMQEEKRTICFRRGQNLEPCLTSKKKNEDRYLDRLNFYSLIHIHIHLYRSDRVRLCNQGKRSIAAKLESLTLNSKPMLKHPVM